jgi:hypothetical protein
MRAQMIVLLLLASCSGGGGNGAGNAAGNVAGNRAAPALDETQQRVLAMPESARHAVLIGAIRDARLDCQHVVSSQAVQQGAGGLPTYVATCDGGKRFVVTIGPGGAGAVQPADAGQAR